MSEKTNTTDIGAQRSLRSAQAARTLIKGTAVFVYALAAARAPLAGGLYPFGIAAVAAAPGGMGVFALLGACVGYLLPAGPEYIAKYLAAIFAVFLIKLVFSGFEGITGSAGYLPCIAAAACGVAGAAAVFSQGLGSAGTAQLFAETAVCACAAYFLGQAAPLAAAPGKLASATARGRVCMVFALCVALLALARINIGVSLGRVIAVVAVLFAARYGPKLSGCAAGAASGMLLGLGDRNMALMLGGYAFGGLMADVFAPAGRFGCTAAFVLAQAVAAISGGGSLAGALTGMYEVTAAAVIFMLLPEKLLARAAAAVMPERAADDAAPGELRERLSDAAGALSDVADMVSQVGGRLSRMRTSDISQVCSGASDTVCRRCAMRMYCWGAAYNDTMAAMDDMTSALRRGGKLTAQDAPRHFSGRCCKLAELIAEMNRRYGDFLTQDADAGRTGIMRGVLVEEFEAMSKYLERMSSRARSGSVLWRDSEQVRAAFAENGIKIRESVVKRDCRGRLSLRAETEDDGADTLSGAARKELVRELSAAVGCRLEGPFGSDGPGEMYFRERPALDCDTGRAELTKTGEKLCGDAAEIFDADGQTVMMISDGMGCGGSAAVDSNLTLRAAERLLRADFGFDEALRTVNAAMMLKSGDESFATLDVTVIDLFAGKAEFFKAGSPPTYLRRSGRAERVSRTSLPVGILGRVRAERASARLRPGDLVVMVSDGVPVEDDAWLTSALERYDGDDPAKLAAAIAAQARAKETEGRGDDITVVAAIIKR
jgi:stage II sporulation protein E